MDCQKRITIKDDYGGEHDFTGLSVVDNEWIKWNGHCYKNIPFVRMHLTSGAKLLLENIQAIDIVDLIINGLSNGELYDSLEYVYIEEIRNHLWAYLSDSNNIDDTLKNANEASIRELRRERWRKLSEKAHISYLLTPEIQIVNKVQKTDYIGKGGETLNVKKALDDLLKKAERQGCLWMDDLMDTSDIYELSLQEIDWLSDQLTMLHIEIRDM